jgi:hypothetical protein
MFQIKAAQNGDMPLLKRALDIGVDPNAKEKDEVCCVQHVWG